MRLIQEKIFSDFFAINEMFKDLEDLRVLKELQEEKNEYKDRIKEYIDNQPELKGYLEYKDESMLYADSVILLNVLSDTSKNGYNANEILLKFDEENNKYKTSSIKYCDERGNDMLLYNYETIIFHNDKDYSGLRFSINENEITLLINYHPYEEFYRTEFKEPEKRESFIFKMFHFESYTSEELDMQKLQYDASILDVDFFNKINLISDGFKKTKIQKVSFKR